MESSARSDGYIQVTLLVSITNPATERVRWFVPANPASPRKLWIFDTGRPFLRGAHAHLLAKESGHLFECRAAARKLGTNQCLATKFAAS